MPGLKNEANVKAKPTAKVDIYFNKYFESHQNPINKVIQWVFVPLFVFGLIGLVWVIPFPYLKFLGPYNGYLNWASFLIAFSIYYYYKLSPVLSYLVLLILFGISYLIIDLDGWQKSGGAALWQVSLIIFALSCAGLFLGNKIEGKMTSLSQAFQFLLIGPIWLLSFVLKKLNIKY